MSTGPHLPPAPRRYDLREIVGDQLRHGPNPDPHLIVDYVLPLVDRARSGSGFAWEHSRGRPNVTRTGVSQMTHRSGSTDLVARARS